MNATERGIREQFSFWRALSSPGSSPEPGFAHVVIGCGTSVHIADSIACALNEAGFAARAVPGNEWTRRASSYVPAGTPTRMLALSRSGESTETVAAAAAGLRAGLDVLGVTCAPGSALTRVSSESFEAETHPEEGIVMTASASLMLMTGLRYAGLSITPDTIVAAEALLEASDPHLVSLIQGRSHFVFLGGGAYYGVAREGALKMQEMSLSQSEAHHPLEYRHGPTSLIDEHSFVVMLYHPDTREEEEQVAREVMEKGAVVLGLGGLGTVSLSVGGDQGAGPLVCLPVLQLLGEYVARANGLDTLAPRHLTKVVTFDA